MREGRGGKEKKKGECIRSENPEVGGTGLMPDEERGGQEKLRLGPEVFAELEGDRGGGTGPELKPIIVMEILG